MTRPESVRRLAGKLGAVVLVVALATSMAPSVAVAPIPIRPSPARAYGDVPVLYERDCVSARTARDFTTCRFGSAPGRRTLVLVGDSKAAQWFTPVRRIARAQGWRLVTILRNGCSFADVTRLKDGGPDRSCEVWGAKALRAVKKMRPGVVIAVTRWNTALPRGATSGQQTEAAMVRGLVSYWRQVLRTGARMVPILDTPGPPSGDVPACVRRNREHLSRCAYPKAPSVRSSGAGAARAAARALKEVEHVNMTPQMCGPSRCPAVIRNILVYRGGSHISDTFATSRTGVLSHALYRSTNGRLGRP